MTITSFWGSSPSVGSTQPGWVTPTNTDLDTAPAALDPDTFRTWTRAKQVDYINAKGSGSPKSLDIGPVGRTVTISIAATETLKLQLPLKSNANTAGDEFAMRDAGREATATELATAPAALDPRVFLAWNREDQLAYVKANGSPLTIGGGVGQPKIFATTVPDVQMNSGVIQYSSGDYEPIPYYYLSGSSTGAPSAIVSASAEALFPTLDGAINKLPVEDRPAKFYTTPAMLTTDALKTAFLEDFATWHSAYQLEYVKTYGTNGTLDISITTPPSRLTAVVSLSDPTKLFIVQSLDKNALAKMTLVEQNQIATTPAFTAIAASLGLASVASAALPSVYTVTTPPTNLSLNAYIQELIDQVNGKTGTDRVEQLPAADKAAFTSQLKILQEQLGQTGVVSPADIQAKVTAIRDRFDRAFAFFDVKAPTETTVAMGNPNRDVKVYSNVISLEGDLSGINRGYAIFIAQEKRIAELAEGRMQIVRDNGVLFGKNLDVPVLVYKFQSLYNLSLEAQVVAETEEINQQNALLKTYAAMQDFVNKTLSKFVKADDGKQRIGGLSVDDYQNLTENEKKLLGMFEDSLGNGQKHPLEVMRSINRPLYDFFRQDPGKDENYDLNEFSHTQWSTYGTRLSEAVTLINQNSQLKMNDINSMDKERNRHFELANNALSKMAEMLTNIGRI